MTNPKRLIGIAVLVALAALASTATAYFVRQSRLNAMCVYNLETICAALHAYSHEAKGEQFPPLSAETGKLMFEDESAYPKYLNDVSVFVSPRIPEREALLKAVNTAPASLVNDRSYWYLSYVLPNERSGLAWIEAYKTLIPKGVTIPNIDTVWPDCLDAFIAHNSLNRRNTKELERLARDMRSFQSASPEMSEKMLPQLRDYRLFPYPFFSAENGTDRYMHVRIEQGVGRMLYYDIGNPDADRRGMRLIPVMIERPELHGNGGHVLYLDGHVEFVKYPGPFPMTKEFIEGLRSLDSL